MSTSATQAEAFFYTLKENTFILNSLPEDIVIPATESRESEVKPIFMATVDDIAFAQRGLNRQLAKVVSQIDALRHLHDTAREYGAKGADGAIEYLRQQQEKSV